jgi:hypothetical protein
MSLFCRVKCLLCLSDFEFGSQILEKKVPNVKFHENSHCELTDLMRLVVRFLNSFATVHDGWGTWLWICVGCFTLSCIHIFFFPVSSFSDMRSLLTFRYRSQCVYQELPVQPRIFVVFPKNAHAEAEILPPPPRGFETLLKLFLLPNATDWSHVRLFTWIKSSHLNGEAPETINNLCNWIIHLHSFQNIQIFWIWLQTSDCHDICCWHGGKEEFHLKVVWYIAVLISTRIIIHLLLQSNTKPNSLRVHPISYGKDTGSTAAVTSTWPLTLV